MLLNEIMANLVENFFIEKWVSRHCFSGALLMALVLSAGSPVALSECFTSETLDDECRYPEGDAWCRDKYSNKPYAYRDKCPRALKGIEREGGRGVQKSTEQLQGNWFEYTNQSQSRPKASVVGEFGCETLKNYYGKGEEWVPHMIGFTVSLVHRGEMQLNNIRSMQDKQSELNHEISRSFSHSTIDADTLKELSENIGLRQSIKSSLEIAFMPEQEFNDFYGSIESDEWGKAHQFNQDAKIMFSVRFAQALKHFGLFDQWRNCVEDEYD